MRTVELSTRIIDQDRFSNNLRKIRCLRWCQCEHTCHFPADKYQPTPQTDHDFGSGRGEVNCEYLGDKSICQHCADDHMQAYVY